MHVVDESDASAFIRFYLTSSAWVLIAMGVTYFHFHLPNSNGCHLFSLTYFHLPKTIFLFSRKSLLGAFLVIKRYT